MAGGLAGLLESSVVLNAVYNNPYTALVSAAVVLLSLFWILGYRFTDKDGRKILNINKVRFADHVRFVHTCIYVILYCKLYT